MKTPLLITILFLTIQIFLQADIRYVNKSSSNSEPPYLSWETAADSIQKAVDICDNGDTIIVANGTYHEYMYIDKTINLLGSSVDSCIINGSSAPNQVSILYFNNNSSVIKNFTITGPGRDIAGQYACILFKSNISISNCKINNIYNAICPAASSPTVENVFFSNINKAIYEECLWDTCHGIYRNNVIISWSARETPVNFGLGGSPTFTNNIMIEQGNTWTALQGGPLRSITVKNNLISGYRTEGILVTTIYNDTAYIMNNTVVYNSFKTQFAYASITTGSGNRTQIKNNIIANSPRGVEGYNDSTRADYNLFWNVEKIALNYAALRDSNIIADPMFVHDTLPTSAMTYDFHLQKYSPAIDKGDPTILDKDGTRSDLGMTGGPGGEEYTYMDLSPRAPVNFTAVVTSDSIKLKWKRNSESDTSYYSVYMDSTADFIIDSTKLISKQTDTLYIFFNPKLNKHYYFKITATDKQGNQSHPSEEIHVILTSTDQENYPIEISDYKLYQNYPNPFNPTTKIGYRLKQKGYVKLLVYDIKGERLKELVNKEQEQGYYEIEFNGSDLASQILLYRIEVIGEGNIPAYSDMKKMIVLK